MIIIAPYAQKLKNGKNNPKNYPFEYWTKLIELIQEPIIQVGVEGENKLVDDCRFNLSIKDLKNLINECHTWISVDSIFQHLAWDCKKKGIVLWSQSNPLIFGHKENVNLLKNRLYLRQNQFLWWEDTEYNPDAFVKPEEILRHL
jgi:ADP-heptose:LPS heptosyltransferase